MAQGEYDFVDDDDEDDGPALGTVKNANHKKRVSSGFPKGTFAAPTPDLGEAITKAIGEGKVQRYGNLDRSELGPQAEALPRLRPKRQLPDPIDAFDWARPDDWKTPKNANKKARSVNLTGLSRKQQKNAVAIPGMAPLFDFLNLYRKANGGWR